MNAPTLSARPQSLHATQHAVAHALTHVAARVEQVGPGRWRLFDEGTQGRPLTVSLDEHWLAVSRPVRNPWLTRLNDVRRFGTRALDEDIVLPTGVRPVWVSGDPPFRICGERPLLDAQPLDPTELGQWIAAVGATGAALSSRKRPQAHGDRPVASPPTGDEAPNQDLAALCEDAGWTVTSRSAEDGLTVELPTREYEVCHVAIGRDDAHVHLRATLAPGDGESMSRACEAAVSLALLRAAGSVRMVRATAALTPQGVRAGLSIRVNVPVDEVLLSHALSALSVAHEQIASELDLLATDTALARAYLSIQGVR